MSLCRYIDSANCRFTKGAKIPGTIHDSKSLFLRETVGTATDPETEIKYEMTTIYSNRQPMVCSSKTGKYFLLSWTDILKLAQEAGIDEE